MILRAVSSFLILPGIVGFLVPACIAVLDPFRGNFWPPGLLALALGTGILLWCVRDFYTSGKGTLAPWDPPRRLVITGLYRHTRNPMYIGVLTLLLGWSLACLSPLILLLAGVLAGVFHVRVVTSEEPRLKLRFDQQWEAYRNHVPRWLPRSTPYHHSQQA